MRKFRFENMKGGYYIGDFEPSAFKTKDFEVAFVKHEEGDTWVKHYHNLLTEINLVYLVELKLMMRSLWQVISLLLNLKKLWIHYF